MVKRKSKTRMRSIRRTQNTRHSRLTSRKSTVRRVHSKSRKPTVRRAHSKSRPRKSTARRAYSKSRKPTARRAHSKHIAYTTYTTPIISSVAPAPAAPAPAVSAPAPQDVRTFKYNSPVIVLGIDTKPNSKSLMLEYLLNELQYDHIIIRDTSKYPQPPSNCAFRNRFWSYRAQMYLMELNKLKIDPHLTNKPVMILDMNDVLIVDKPHVVKQKFDAMNADVVLSGTSYCCNLNTVNVMLNLNLITQTTFDGFIRNDTASVNQVCEIARKLWKSDGYLSYPQANDIINQMNLIPAPTFHKYINAGTIIGKIDPLIKAYLAFDKSDTLDDEEEWHKIFIKQHQSMHLKIDYFQEIFAVMQDMTGRYDEVAKLHPNGYIQTDLYKIINDNIFGMYKKASSVIHFVQVDNIPSQKTRYDAVLDFVKKKYNISKSF